MIEVQNLSKTYLGGVEAVRNVTFHIAAGEVFGLLGPNGAGKSTTIGMLTTTVVPTSGYARVAGHDVAGDPIAARHASAVVFQDAVVDRALSGRRNLENHARLWGVDRATTKSRIDELIDVFELGAIVDRPVGGFSGGERRRLEIARALLSRPEVLFLDEPTVGLDTRIRYELLDVIAGIRDAGETTVLLTTHYLDEADRLCDRVAIVHAGRVVALDAPNALLGALGDAIVEVRVAHDAPAALAALRGAGVASEDAFTVGTTISLPMRDTPTAEVITRIDALGLPTIGISSRAPTLDDVYLHLTGDRLAA